MNLPAFFFENLTASLKTSRRLRRLPDPETLTELESGPSPWFLALLRLGLFSLFLVFVTNLAVLAVFEGPYFRRLSQANSLKKLPLTAARGLILDSQGTPLAVNVPSFDLYFYASLCERQNCDLKILQDYPFFTADRAESFKNSQETTVVRDLPQAVALDLEQKLKNRPYLQIKPGQKRSYPQLTSFFHVLGYVSQASPEDLAGNPSLLASQKVGRLGLEKVYDLFLEGKPGGQIFEIDAAGREVRALAQISPIEGNSLVLNLRADLQRASQTALAEGLKKTRALGGAVVVEEVKTGKILALVSLPALDGNIFSTLISPEKFQELEADPSHPFFNRAALAAYPPGSVFKVSVAATALAEKIVDEETLIDGPGSLTLGASIFRDWKPEGHGRVNIFQALAQSCDTCFYKIGGGGPNFTGLGVGKLTAGARLFGFGSISGIDLPAEASGLVPDEAWKKRIKGERFFTGDTYNLAIGQGDLLATPLQVNSMTAAVANGGTLWRPYLAEKITDGRGATIRSFEPTVVRRNFITGKILAEVRRGLLEATEPGGTAYPFFNFKIKIGGKTGTAQTSFGKTHAWFTAFAPYDDPQIALTVFLENGGEGSRDAAPVARQILSDYFHLNDQKTGPAIGSGD